MKIGCIGNKLGKASIVVMALLLVSRNIKNQEKIVIPGNNKPNSRMSVGKEVIHPEATYEYDDSGRMTKVEYDNGTVIEYEYDDAGNLTNVKVIEPSKEEEENKKDNTTSESDDNTSSNNDNTTDQNTSADKDTSTEQSTSTKNDTEDNTQDDTEEDQDTSTTEEVIEDTEKPDMNVPLVIGIAATIVAALAGIATYIYKKIKGDTHEDKN